MPEAAPAGGHGFTGKAREVVLDYKQHGLHPCPLQGVPLSLAAMSLFIYI